MTDAPRMPNALERFQLPLWAKVLIALPAIGFPLAILIFILRNDYVHDESRCPYREVKRETIVPGAIVVEERRSCVDGIEDRRYTVHRDDDDVVRPLGNRRLPTPAFEPPAYRWTAEQRNQQMFLKVHVNGHPDAEFREGTDEERNM
jgi:hypothetical protein